MGQRVMKALHAAQTIKSSLTPQRQCMSKLYGTSAAHVCAKLITVPVCIIRVACSTSLCVYGIHPACLLQLLQQWFMLCKICSVYCAALMCMLYKYTGLCFCNLCYPCVRHAKHDTHVGKAQKAPNPDAGFELSCKVCQSKETRSTALQCLGGVHRDAQGKGSPMPSSSLRRQPDSS